MEHITQKFIQDFNTFVDSLKANTDEAFRNYHSAATKKYSPQGRGYSVSRESGTLNVQPGFGAYYLNWKAYEHTDQELHNIFRVITNKKNDIKDRCNALKELPSELDEFVKQTCLKPGYLSEVSAEERLPLARACFNCQFEIQRFIESHPRQFGVEQAQTHADRVAGRRASASSEREQE